MEIGRTWSPGSRTRSRFPDFARTATFLIRKRGWKSLAIRDNGWLVREGGLGAVIRAFADSPAVDAQTYFQRQVEGRPVSALVLGDGARCRVLGFSEQWSTFQNGRPFRFAGAARPAALSRSLEAQLASAIERVYAAVPLVGSTASISWRRIATIALLEANPRPGATFDIFEPITTGPDTLLGQHVAACEGRLARAVGLDGACASQIVYADREIGCLPKLDWPDWARDRQVECSRSPAAIRSARS